MSLFLEKILKFIITNLVPSVSFRCKRAALFSKKLLCGRGSSLCRTPSWLLLKISQSTPSVYTFPHLYSMLPAGNNGTCGETLLVNYLSKNLRKERMEVRFQLPSQNFQFGICSEKYWIQAKVKTTQVADYLPLWTPQTAGLRDAGALAACLAS